jgi:glucose-6-phosphate isomerase
LNKLERIKPDETVSWEKLGQHFNQIKEISLRKEFIRDEGRFKRFCIKWGDMLLDYSKNLITEETMKLLLSLAQECNVPEAIEALFTGEKINETESRAALHTALRNRSGKPVYFEGKDVMPQILQELEKMRIFSEKLRRGLWRGYSGNAITDIVNIGIGGSDLVPVMVTEALRFYSSKDLKVHFVSNNDGTHITETLKGLDPETTLFLGFVTK